MDTLHFSWFPPAFYCISSSGAFPFTFRFSSPEAREMFVRNIRIWETSESLVASDSRLQWRVNPGPIKKVTLWRHSFFREKVPLAGHESRQSKSFPLANLIPRQVSLILRLASRFKSWNYSGHKNIQGFKLRLALVALVLWIRVQVDK